MPSTQIQQRKNGADIKRLNPKQQLFVLYALANWGCSYVVAAKEAGYKQPKQTANNLLKNPVVKAILGKELRERVERLKMDGDRILREVEYCALRDPLDLCDENGRIIIDDMRKIPERMRRCIDGIKCKSHVDENGIVHQEIELKMVSKMSALELAAKHFGLLLPQQHEHKIAFDLDSLSGREPERLEVAILDAKVEDV